MANLETLGVKEGVFLHSKNLDSEFMIKCLQMLVNNFPRVKITSVVVDELHFGYRVHFSAPKADEVLAKKYLLVSGENIRIGHLRSSLTIHGVQKNGGGKFEGELRENIWNKFGKLLHVDAVSNPENEATKNLRAVVDVPEVEELEVFNHEGFPDMFVCLPDSDEKLKVTFHCRRCTNDGHVEQNCPNVLSPKEEIKAELTNGSIDSKDVSAPKPFPIRLESPNSYAEKIGREEVLKTGILSEGNKNDTEGIPGPSSSSAKASNGKNKTTEFFPFMKIKEEIEDSDYHTNGAKGQTNSDLGNDGKYSDHDDEVQVIDFREVSNSSNSRQTFELKSENRDEETNSNDNFGAAADRYMPEHSPSAGPSSRNTPAKPVIAVEVTRILSRQLQKCIDDACEEFKILGRDKLDAFLVHVKKKSNPLKIAKNFTANEDKLKEQLQRIIELFYNTPQAGTKNDTQFIKWLTGLVERFDGTIPKKRKRSDRSDSPRKK